MKKNNYENVDREKRNLKVATYIRVGSMEQLNLKAEQRHSNLKMENFQKGGCNVDSGYEKEKGIGYTGLIGSKLLPLEYNFS